MRIEGVLFDIDGTLIDSNEQHVIAWGLAFQEAGHPQEADDIRGQIGKGGDLLVPELLPEANELSRETIADRQGAYFKDMYLDRVQPFERAADLVRAVHASGKKVALASSAKREELEYYIELLGLKDILDATTSIDDVEASKPEPDIFQAALEKLGVAPENAVVVGDTPYDVDAARKIGVATIGLTSGPFTAAQLRDAGAQAVYANAADLLDHLDDALLTSAPP